MNAHLAQADHLQAQSWAHLHNAMTGYHVREELTAAEQSLRGIHSELREFEREASSLLSTARPVLAEVAVRVPDRDEAEMADWLTLSGPDLADIRSELMKCAVNAVGWIESIDRHVAAGQGAAATEGGA